MQIAGKCTKQYHGQVPNTRRYMDHGIQYDMNRYHETSINESMNTCIHVPGTWNGVCDLITFS